MCCDKKRNSLKSVIDHPAEAKLYCFPRLSPLQPVDRRDTVLMLQSHMLRRTK